MDKEAVTRVMGHGLRLKKHTLFKAIWTKGFLLISMILLLTACQKIDSPKISNHASEQKKTAEQAVTETAKPKTIKTAEQDFERNYGWLNSKTILYSERISGSELSQLIEFDLTTGKTFVLYQPQSPLVNVSISPSGDYILVHTGPSTHKALVDIIDRTGSILYSFSIPSVELEYEWNVENETELLLSGFLEDWSFTNYIVHIEDRKLEAVSLPQPFVQWSADQELLYLDWDSDEPMLTAPLIRSDLTGENRNTVVDKVIQFKRVKSALMTIEVDGEEEDEAIYSFYGNDDSLMGSFVVPHLSNFSDWIIPYFHLNENSHLMVTFVPSASEEADLYDGKFKLIAYDWKTKKQSVIMDEIENAPLSCSPDGKQCLYGNQLEKLISLKNKDLNSLIP